MRAGVPTSAEAPSGRLRTGLGFSRAGLLEYTRGVGSVLCCRTRGRGRFGRPAEVQRGFVTVALSRSEGDHAGPLGMGRSHREGDGPNNSIMYLVLHGSPGQRGRWWKSCSRRTLHAVWVMRSHSWRGSTGIKISKR